MACMHSDAPDNDAAARSRRAKAVAHDKSDMYVTALDVFSRRGYFDPQIGVNGGTTTPSFGAATVTAKPQEIDSENLAALTQREHSRVQPEEPSAVYESAICKLKHFSSPTAYTVANSVKDDLNETLGRVSSTQIYVSKDMLFEKRRLFFETLFTHADDLHAALPCRFSIEDIDELFQNDGQKKTDASTLYRQRLAALERLRETLDC